MLSYPGLSLVILSVVLGIWLLIYGVVEIVAAFRIRGMAQPPTGYLTNAH